MIEIKNVSKVFKNQKGIIDFSLNIKPGAIIGLIGDNGAGKTTLIKSVFNEYKRDSGDVFHEGVSIYISNYVKKISFFPDQSVYPKNISIKDYCLLEAELSGVKRNEALEQFNKLIAAFGLKDYQNKRFRELSAGMQKKALLINTLISSPDYIILDEPTANLDVKNRIEFLKILKDLAKTNVGILITSHLIDELEQIISWLVIVENGQTVYSQAFDKEHDSLAEIYLSKTKSSEHQNIVDLVKKERG